jgi:hypothetical protein
MTPVASGTYVNATHWSYTFLCSGCVLSDGTTFAANATTDVLGWAFATAAPATPASHSSTLAKHSSQGNYGMSFTTARTAKFGDYAAMVNTSMTPMAFKA